jgi:hypothetical protein
MSAHFTLGAVGAETSEVVGTKLATDMLLGAVGAKWAESHVVMRAGR